MSNIIIRPATQNDADAIYGFVCDLEDEEFDKAAFDTCYQLCLAGAKNHYLVAEINNEAVGYISCQGQVLLHHTGLVYEIQELFVKAEYRNKNIGKLLLQAMEELIGKEDYVLLEVSSNMQRKDAHRFYLSNGFKLTNYRFKKAPDKK